MILDLRELKESPGRAPSGVSDHVDLLLIISQRTFDTCCCCWELIEDAALYDTVNGCRTGTALGSSYYPGRLHCIGYRIDVSIVPVAGPYHLGTGTGTVSDCDCV